MIRHRPFGLGHPYRLEPDQRVPVIPIANEPFELRVVTDPAARAVQVETLRDGRRTYMDADPVQSGPRQTSWIARPTPIGHGSELRYRFVAEGVRGKQKTAWFKVSAARWESSGGRLVFEPPDLSRVIPDKVEWLVGADGPVRVRLALSLARDEHVVGFGERFDALDQRGRRLDAVVFEQYKAQGNRTYLPMPFAIVAGGDGWGFHVQTSRRTWFDVGCTEKNELRIEAALDPEEPALTINFFKGSPHRVLRDFLEQTGNPKLPPSWIFRPWMSGNEWNTQARVMAEVERSRTEDIPTGVVVIEAWSDESTFVAFKDAEYTVHRDGSPHRLADFGFPAEGAWPNPKQMVEELHARGIRVLLWQIPLLKARPKPASQARCDQDTMLARGYAVSLEDGCEYRNRGPWFPGALMLDFTSTEARDWWLAKRCYLLEEVGIDGFKTDGGEHAWGDDLRYANGARGDEGNNAYPVAYAAAYHELLSSLGRDGITFSRAGFTVSPAYPCHWAGDESSTWEAFQASITAGLTAGASGIFFWGWDLAGFSGETPTAELYLRAAAAACFCPIMQYHSEFNFHRSPSIDRTPWNIAERTGEPRVLSIYGRFARLRDLLVPYLSEQAARSVETRKPLMRALFFDASDDPHIWKWPYQYFLGDDLLVSPVVRPGVQSWSVYLPAGEWVDAWTRQEHPGLTTIQRDVPLEEIPVYIRRHRAEHLLPHFAQASDQD